MKQLLKKTLNLLKKLTLFLTNAVTVTIFLALAGSSLISYGVKLIFGFPISLIVIGVFCFIFMFLIGRAIRG